MIESFKISKPSTPLLSKGLDSMCSKALQFYTNPIYGHITKIDPKQSQNPPKQHQIIKVVQQFTQNFAKNS